MMQDTWFSRDLPVLEATLRLLDDMPGSLPEGHEIAAGVSLSLDDVGRALMALDGEYLDVRRAGSGFGSWFVAGATAQARRVSGQWPTMDVLVERLADGISQAAEREADPDRKARLRAVGRELAGMARDVTVSVLSAAIGQHVPR